MLNASVTSWLSYAGDAISAAPLRPLLGVVAKVHGPVVRANFSHAQIGQICELMPSEGATPIIARVIALEGSTAVLSPFSDCSGVAVGCLVRPISSDITVPGGSAVLGRILDGLGKPLDNGGPISDEAKWVPARGSAPDPMSRKLIDTTLVTGIKAIDSTISLGKGQRVGIFGPPGTGKTSLLTALAQHSEVDAIVIDDRAFSLRPLF